MLFHQTLSGKKFNYLNATVNDIEIEDIATALSHLCRFCGHLPEFYSVAQHSVLCSQLVPPMFAFEALMHDAAEVYYHDIPAPLKALLPDYRQIEAFVDELIRFQFNLSLTFSPDVKYADLKILATERRDLDISDDDPWPMLEDITPFNEILVSPVNPNQARSMFMQRYQQLISARGC
ncbi:MAG: HD family hydrolase [Serratia symbiotica]|nr:HD family hydrolase [Serratia symbiotica]